MKAFIGEEEEEEETSIKNKNLRLCIMYGFNLISVSLIYGLISVFTDLHRVT